MTIPAPNNDKILTTKGGENPPLRVNNVLSCGLFEVSFAPYYGVGTRVATGGTQQRGLKTSVLGRFQGVKKASWG